MRRVALDERFQHFVKKNHTLPATFLPATITSNHDGEPGVAVFAGYSIPAGDHTDRGRGTAETALLTSWSVLHCTSLSTDH